MSKKYVYFECHNCGGTFVHECEIGYNRCCEEGYEETGNVIILTERSATDDDKPNGYDARIKNK